jgi:hypothetical protein
MNKAQVLAGLIRVEADVKELREALQADMREENHTPPEEFRVDEPPDLFREEPPVPPSQRPGHFEAVKASEVRDPLAKSMADLVTPKQLGMIRAVAREAGVDPEAECQDVYRCKTEELSKRAASGLIDHLKEMQRQGRVSA